MMNHAPLIGEPLHPDLVFAINLFFAPTDMKLIAASAEITGTKPENAKFNVGFIIAGYEFTPFNLIFDLNKLSKNPTCNGDFVHHVDENNRQMLVFFFKNYAANFEFVGEGKSLEDSRKKMV